jgi:hypothetical protein
MKKTYFWMACIVAALALSILACGFSASTANISEATLTRDEAGNDPTTTFSPGDTFYLIVQLANAPDDTVVKASWTAVDVEGADPNTFIDESEITSGSGTITFNLTNSQGQWPAGSYKVDLYLNDELERTLEFSVQ